jgi:hypothetical protein
VLARAMSDWEGGWKAEVKRRESGGKPGSGAAAEGRRSHEDRTGLDGIGRDWAVRASCPQPNTSLTAIHKSH